MLTLLLYFSVMIANIKGADQTARKRSVPLFFFEISCIEAHVMLKPRHPCFCLAVRLYLEINTRASEGLGELGRRAIYFQGAGLHW